mgnify:CR=1 FL=1
MSGPPQVVHVATSLDFGGVETHLATIGETRAQAAFEPVFCAISGGGAAADALRASGARVVCLDAPARIPSPAAIYALWKLLRRVRPGVVHAHGAEANFHGLVAGFLAGVPVRVAEEIGIPSHGRIARRVFRACYRLAHAVVGVSDGVTRWLVASGEVPPAKAVTVLNPVRLPDGRGGVLPPMECMRFCHVGRLEAVKNLPALLAAFASLVASTPGDRIELWLVGDGSQRAGLEGLARELGIAAQVRFLGFQADPAPLLRQCHVSVQSSLSEGFGLAMVEAMGCELPVLSTRVGAAEQVIEDGRTGWLVDGFDMRHLLEGMQRACAAGPAKRLAMGSAARDTVHRMFTPTDYLARVERLYAAPGARQGSP